ncbi:hypothetical protein [Deinococcus ruber]|uniref:ZU5 domain-containing protein n=1 Tax=Deinococcus ruber TaxID=1848197 RepID=A0A918CPF9_9DEIO|nr:hypothetical protein [Deinococcus ruber]GGR33435.1 hypothetical protein GCM10008957_49650 [Deinococcus ruber]
MNTHFGLLALLALTLAACGTAPSPAGQPGDPSPLPNPGIDGRTPRPVNVQITLESGHTAEGVLTPTGGTLTATAADGTTFTLTAPENAVLSPLKVKMTPVAQVSGLNGANTYVAAVHLEPEGTEFLEPLRLKISAPHALDTHLLRGFNSHRPGSEFYFQGRSVEGNTATLQLTHFSNPGIAVVADDDLIVPIPTDARDRLENDLAQPTRASMEILGDFSGWIEPDLKHAASSDSALRQAIREFVTWRTEVERAGLSDRFRSETFQGWTLIAQGIEAAVERAHAECAVNNDLSRVRDILTWMSWVKRNPRLSPYFSGQVAHFEQLARDCASFELDVQSTVSGDQDGAVVGTGIHLAIPLQPGSGDLLTHLEAAGPVQVLGYAADISADSGCTVSPLSATLQGDTQAALDLLWAGDSAAPVAVTLDPPVVTVSVGITCPDNGSFTTQLPTWRTWFMAAHQDECSALGCLRIEDWEAGTGAEFARKTYQRTAVSNGLELSESTTLTLRHTPH